MVFNLILTAAGLGAGLAMDAFAAAVSNGMIIKKTKFRHEFITGIFFGFFQMLMPMIGWISGIGLSEYIEDYAHWLAFFLLLFIGGKMILESLRKNRADKEKCCENPMDFKTLTLMAIATSIDAMLVGVSFAAGKMTAVNAFISSAVIGLITFVISFLGVKIGGKTAGKAADKAGVFGGGILIAIGTKILLEGLHIINV